MELTFTGPMQDGYHVHKAGCADLRRRDRRGDATWTEEIESRKDAVFAIYCDVMGDTYLPEEYDQHWQEYDDLRVFPCIRNLPEV